MDHLFEVGKEYRNRDGRYEVLAIAGPKMRIRYEDGRELVVTVAVQQRIWETMRLEEQAPKQGTGRGKKGPAERPFATRQGYDFNGLRESDFFGTVTGTTWRSRASLGGRLAQQLSETTPYVFQAHAIYRRPSVYLTMPDHYDPEDGFPYAKNELRLLREGALYGFYVERPGQSRGMDSTWHWGAFLRALEDEALLQELETAMRQHTLFWLLGLEEGQDTKGPVKREITVQAGAPLSWREGEEAEALDWAEFRRRLNGMPPEQWLNVHLAAWTDKETAVAAAEGFAEQVSEVMRAVLPLYVAAAAA